MIQKNNFKKQIIAFFIISYMLLIFLFFIAFSILSQVFEFELITELKTKNYLMIMLYNTVLAGLYYRDFYKLTKFEVDNDFKCSYLDFVAGFIFLVIILSASTIFYLSVLYVY
jgi:hypothetical protein